MNMSVIGGFLGGYAIFLRCDIFASAQTVNLIKFFENIITENNVQALLLMGAFLIYVFMLILACVIPHFIKGDFRLKCIVIMIIAMTAIGFIPENINDLLALYPIFAITALQWGIFSGNKEFSSSTIFSTNNIKQTVAGFVDYIITKDNKQKRKFAFYGFTLLSFYTGVVLGILSVLEFAEKGIFGCIMFGLTGIVLIIFEKDINKN